MAGIIDRLRKTPTKPTHLQPSEMDLTANTAGEKSVIATFKADVPFVVRSGEMVRLQVTAYEEKTTGGAGTQETFTLAENMVDEAADSFVLFSGNSRASADSVDFAGDSFDYTDGGSTETLHVYYMTDAQAPIEVRKVAPKNVQEDLISEENGINTVRDTYKDPITFSPNHPLEGVVPEDWEVEVSIKAGYSVQWADETDTDAKATNMTVDLPIRRAGSKVPGLKQAVKNAVGSQ